MRLGLGVTGQTLTSPFQLALAKTLPSGENPTHEITSP
jgi:hypothetical protein